MSRLIATLHGFWSRLLRTLGVKTLDISDARLDPEKYRSSVSRLIDKLRDFRIRLLRAAGIHALDVSDEGLDPEVHRSSMSRLIDKLHDFRIRLLRAAGIQALDVSDEGLGPEGRLGPATEDWHLLAERAMVEEEPLRARQLLYGIAILMALLFTWSAFAEIDVVTRGLGKVIPSRQVQVVGSQDGGVITEILVREGDQVTKGQLLLKLDQTRSLATLGESRAELLGLQVRAERLRAVVNGTAFEPAAEIASQIPGTVDQEMQLYLSTRDELSVLEEIAQQQLVQRQQELAELQAREAQLATESRLADEELETTRPMMASGAVSEVELLRLQREVNKASGELKQTQAQLAGVKAAIEEARGKLKSVRLDFLNMAREELADTDTRINALKEANEGLSDRVRQTNLTSPVTGIVKQLLYNTERGVVMPGRDIIELIPSDDTLLVQLQVKPQDIAFLAPGQVANVKVTAYDFVVYGGLKGVVEQIGVDTVLDEEGNAFYEVRVRTDTGNFGPDKPIIPGMTVEVDILTGKRTVLAYLLKPVLRARQRALSER